MVVVVVVGQAITDLTSGPSFDFTFTIGPELDKWKVGINNSVQIHLLSLLSICVFAQNRHREREPGDKSRNIEHKLTWRGKYLNGILFWLKFGAGQKEFDLRQKYNSRKSELHRPGKLSSWVFLVAIRVLYLFLSKLVTNPTRANC